MIKNNHTKTFVNKYYDKFLTESEYHSITNIFNLDVFQRHFAKLVQSKILLRNGFVTENMIISFLQMKCVDQFQ